MKYLIYTLALISAFFVSNAYSQEPDLTDLQFPKSETQHCIKAFGSKGCADSRKAAYYAACEAHIAKETLPADTNEKWGWSVECDNRTNSENNPPKRYYSFKQYCQFCENREQDSGTSAPITYTDYNLETVYSCPPDMYPFHKIAVPRNPVPTDPNQPTYDCAKPLEEIDPDPDPDPDNNCDEFGNHSFLPPNGVQVPTGGSVCHTDSDGNQCAYKKNELGDGFTQTGSECTNEDTPYGDQPDIEPDPNDPDKCAVVGSLEFFAVCPVDPNEVCNQLQINNDIVHQCPSGCGSVNGQYVCAHEDDNANGIPDKDENPDNPDPDDPDPDDPDNNNPDMTETNNKLDSIGNSIDGLGSNIDGLGLKIDGTNTLLNGIGGKLDGLGESIGEGNASLTSIDTNTKLTSQNTDAIAGNTSGILDTLSETSVGNTFNPDSSASFYESSYEEGFSGVWEEKSVLFEQTETIQFLQQFKFNSGGSPPDTQICFNLGASMNFGCADLPTPSAELLAIIRIFILITAAFLCRALIFGG